MANKIPTAEEYINNQGFATWATLDSSDTMEVVINYQDCLQAMIEFAKLHVEAALKTASEEAEMKSYPYNGCPECGRDDMDIDKPSILNAYPLTNIK